MLGGALSTVPLGSCGQADQSFLLLKGPGWDIWEAQDPISPQGPWDIDPEAWPVETQRIPAICGLWIIELNSSSCSDLQSEKEFHLLIVVLFSHSVVSASLRPRGLQHARLPCPSPSPGLPKFMSIESVMPSTISSSAALFSSPSPLLPPPWKGKWKSKSVTHVSPFATPWTLHSMEASRPEYWSG